MLAIAQPIHHELWSTQGLSSGAGTQATSSGSTNTKGSWAQVVASTPRDADALRLDLSVNGNGFAIDGLVDVGVGPSGSEVTIFSNLPVWQTLLGNGWSIDLPYPLPAGSRIALRGQASLASVNFRLLARLIYLSRCRCSDVSILGSDTSDSGGVGIDPGTTANTKPAWVQLVASTTTTLRRLLVFAGLQGHSTITAQWDVDIAIGPSGSEVVVADHLHFAAGAGGSSGPCPAYREVHVEIPAGSRICVRASCSSGTSTIRLLDVGVVGYEEQLVDQALPYRRYEGARQALGYGNPSPTTVTSGSSNTLGSNVEIASASGAAATGLTVFAQTATTGDGYLNLYFGASGSEVLQFSLPMTSSAASALACHSYTFGWCVPAATRVSAKFQSNTGSAAALVGVQLLDGPIEQCGSITALGINASDSGGLGLDPTGTANTKSAWGELSSSLPHDLGKIYLVIGGRQNTAPTACNWNLDVGVGASGSEVAILTDVHFRLLGASGQILPAVVELTLPSGVAAGTRLAVRASCTITDATDRLLDVTAIVVSMGAID